MIVIPQCAQRLSRVAICGLELGIGESSQRVGIVLIIELPALEKVAGVAVAFRRRVSVVQVRRNGRQSKASIIGRQLIEISNQRRLAILGDVGWAREDPLVARSEEHTSELQSLRHLVCRLLLEKKK